MEILRPQAELAQNRLQRARGQIAAAGRHHRKSATEACHHMPALPSAAVDLGAEAAQPAQKLTTGHA
jgi:hypothetical protein